jgi:hypothetical protein
MKYAAVFAGALLAGAAALAQAPARAPALPPRYEVEIIVFAHRNFDPSEERFEQEPEAFRRDAPIELREVPVFDESFFAEPAPGTIPDPAISGEPLAPEPPLEPPPVDPIEALREEALKTRLLARDELKLGNEYRRLAASSAYEPLLHTGWVQPGLPEADATPFDLSTLGIVNPSGTVRVHLSRFLHITLDLTYRRSAGSAAMRTGADGLNEIVLGEKYRLKATRSARSNELHYFDHPAFGVLVRVTPVPETGGSGRPAA